jgi:hypothetical protein
MQHDWTKVDTALDAVEAGVSIIKTENAALREQIDPTTQAKIDSVGTRLQAIADGLALPPLP